MNNNKIVNNIYKEFKLISPKKIKKEFGKINYNNILNNKKIISNIIHKKDNRFIIVCGPCSIHDYDLSINYANKLKKLQNKFKEHLYIIMRVYLEKPRTSLGWKGFINDPNINNTFDIENGLRLSRKLLLDIYNKINIPVGMELLNILIPNYILDLVSWVSIGARTSESQIYRELSSSLNIPVGFKNNIYGYIEPSINSIISSSNSHNFISINNNGKICIINSKGNKNCHIILRGSINKINYKIKHINKINKKIKKNKINNSIIIDCSHDNSKKNFKLQKYVSNYIINKRKYNKNIIGIMLESNIKEGKQNITKKLKYGISITDSCIGWDETEYIINNIYNIIRTKKIK